MLVRSMVASQIEVEIEEIDEIKLYTGNHVAPGSFAWLVPTHDSLALLGAVSRDRLNGKFDKLILMLKLAKIPPVPNMDIPLLFSYNLPPFSGRQPAFFHPVFGAKREPLRPKTPLLQKRSFSATTTVPTIMHCLSILTDL